MSKDMEKLGDFLKCGYHNTDEQIIKLYEAIHQYYPDLSTTKLVKRTIYKYIFPGEDYDDLRMRKLMSSLVSMIKKFLRWEELETDENKNDQEKLLIKSLSQRNYKKFIQHIDAEINRVQKIAYKSREDYQYLGWLYEKRLSHPEARTFGTQRVSEQFQQLQENLDRGFVFSKLVYGLEAKNRKDIFQGPKHIPLLQQAIALADDYEDETERFSTLKTLLNLQTAAEFTSAMEVFITGYQGKLAAIPEGDFLLNSFVTKAIDLMNSGEKGFDSILLRLYQFALNEQVLPERGIFRPILFTNIVVLAAALHQFEWADSFMEQYASYLKADERQDVLHLSNAFFYYHRGLAQRDKEQLRTAQELLQSVPAELLENDLRVRSLDLRLAYECEVLSDDGDAQKVLLLARNFRKHLNKNKVLSQKRKDSYLLFIETIQELSRLQTSSNPNKKRQRLHLLQAKLTQAESVVSKTWLDEKIAMAQQTQPTTLLLQ